MADRASKLAGVWLLLTLTAVAALAHPFHTTTAEAELNPATDRLEVALRVTPEDLEQTLEKRLGRKLRLEDEKALDAPTADYLREVFELRCGAAEEASQMALKWVGWELGIRQVWLYFELAVPEDLAGCVLSNRVFFERSKQQINTVVLRISKQRRSLTFTAEQTEVKLLDSIEKETNHESQADAVH